MNKKGIEEIDWDRYYGDPDPGPLSKKDRFYGWLCSRLKADSKEIPEDLRDEYIAYVKAHYPDAGKKIGIK